jgi:hypothetical protein
MNRIAQALRSKYIAQIDEAVATLDIYLNNSVGIGEHSDILAEADKYVELLSSAQDKLASLDRLLTKPNGENQAGQDESAE